MKRFVTLLALIGVCGMAAGAAAVPLPRSRPAVTPASPPPSAAAVPAAKVELPADVSSAPTPCDQRLAAMAVMTLMPRLIGPGACGGRDLVELDAVLAPDKHRIAIAPPAMLNCRMAESLAGWLRDAVAPRVAKFGSRLVAIENYDSYDCRTRNRVPGAKLSEHAHGDAIDVRALRLADGRRLALTDPQVDAALRRALRDSACHRFTTVLGPGEAYHNGHIHLDDIVRHGGYRICEWDVFTAPPLPRRRPLMATAH